MPESINKIQRLQLDLIRLSSFNEFNGPAVVDSLLAHQDLWRAVIIDRADYYYRDGSDPNHQEPVDLIKLRDLEAGYWNVDTLYILPAEGKETELELLVHRDHWGADEVDWMQNTHVGKYLRVWWD